MKSKLQLEKGKTYIVISSPENYHATRLNVLKDALKKLKLDGIYISLNASSKEILDMVKKEGLDASKLFVIDGISGKNLESNKEKRCVCIDGPNSLTELSLSITDITNKNKVGFLIFDSLSTMLIYNNPTIIETFMHYMVNKLNALNITGVILTISEEASNKIVPMIQQFCEECISV